MARKRHSANQQQQRGGNSEFIGVMLLELTLQRQGGVSALRRDLASGEWERRYGGLLEQPTLDLGYRLVVA